MATLHVMQRSFLLAASLVALVLIGAAAGNWLIPSATDNTKPHRIDVGFVQAMSLHHQQAILAAQLLQDGRPTRLTGLLRNIVNSQLYEYGKMQGWLALWDEPLYQQPLVMDWMLLGDDPPDDELRQYLLDCERSPRGMPGLATSQELNRLRELQGDGRDRAFLRLMLAHHQGGIPMARFASVNARQPVVRQIAKAIMIEQLEDIGRMRRMLAVLDHEQSGADATEEKTQ